MVRTRSYDETQVLTGAMHAFRRKGYYGVSIPELEARDRPERWQHLQQLRRQERNLSRGVLALSERSARETYRRVSRSQPHGLSGSAQLFLTLAARAQR